MAFIRFLSVTPILLSAEIRAVEILELGSVCTPSAEQIIFLPFLQLLLERSETNWLHKHPDRKRPPLLDGILKP